MCTKMDLPSACAIVVDLVYRFHIPKPLEGGSAFEKDEEEIVSSGRQLYYTSSYHDRQRTAL
jgi:hypothetical protein